MTLHELQDSNGQYVHLVDLLYTIAMRDKALFVGAYIMAIVATYCIMAVMHWRKRMSAGMAAWAYTLSALAWSMAVAWMIAHGAPWHTR